jgi:integrase/recombinase XerD
LSALTQAELTAAIRSHIKRLETQQIRPTTIYKYNQCLATFQQYLGSQPVSADSAINFLHHLTLRGFKPATIRAYYHALKPFLASVGIPINMNFRKCKTLPVYHSPDQVQAILNVISKRSDRWHQLKERDTLIILMLAYTGMRRSELLALKVRHIDFYSAMVRVTGKGQNQRAIPIAPTIYHRLQQYTESMQPGDLLFPIKPRRLWALVSRYGSQAGIENFHPHSLRHWFATQLIKANVSLKTAQELLGHADISTTALYIDLIPKHLTNAVSRLPKLLSHPRDKT